MKQNLTAREKKILDFSFYPYRYRLGENLKRKEILAFIGDKKNGVDLGCGSGWLAASLARSGKQMKAVDLSDPAIDSARYFFKKEHLKIPVIKSSIKKLPFKKEEFDFAVLCEVLEHIPDPAAALTEISRCLKNNGKLCLSVPNGWTFGLVYDRFLLRFFTDSNENGGSARATVGAGKESSDALRKIGIKSSMNGFGHVNQFNIFSIKKLVEQNGFKVINIKSLELFSPYVSTFLCGLLKIDRKKMKKFDKLDQLLVRFFPRWLAANWLVTCQKCPKK